MALPSSLTAFTPVAERSEATPGLFNSRLQQLQDNIATVNSGMSARIENADAYLTFVGAEAGISDTPNTTISGNNQYGNRNTGIGAQALKVNTVGINNTAVGALAMASNIGSFDGGNDNVAVGHKALFSNSPLGATSEGINNVAVGAEAMMANRNGRNNVAVGTDALSANTYGDYNVAVGHVALQNSLTTYNTAVGALALNAATTGERNTAVGGSSLFTVTTGGFNTAVGMSALFDQTTANDNVAVGYFAGRENTTGIDNTYLGSEAGRTQTSANANMTGSRNVYVGRQSGPGSTSILTNAIGVGYRAQPLASNSAVIGGTGANAVTLGVGTSVVTGATVGDDIRPRGATYRTVNSAGTGTTPLIGGDTNYLTTVSGEAQSVASNAEATICANTKAGILMVFESQYQSPAIFALLGTGNATRRISDTEAKSSTTKDNAGTTNIYYQSNAYILQNKLGVGAATYRVVLLGG